MNTKRIRSGMLSLIFVLSGAGFLVGLAISDAQMAPVMDQRELQSDQTGKMNPNTIQPAIPPMNDAEMVIKPDVPPNPDAIIIPPVVDPEMAVDPSTRQPMTSEKLEEITPEKLDKNTPDRDQQRLPDK